MKIYFIAYKQHTRSKNDWKYVDWGWRNGICRSLNAIIEIDNRERKKQLTADYFLLLFNA